MLDSHDITRFQAEVWAHYDRYARHMPWRDDPSPYRVLVSELMLQQTQVERVRPKFLAFMRQFPDIDALAAAPLSQVLQAWSGLGYNRRAKFLWQAADIIARTHRSQIPDTLDDLVALPGIGRNTAGAILAYAYDRPAAFIETNIRTVYFHHFFSETAEPVSDKELLAYVEQTLDADRPREWYYALMDYGTWLKREAGGRLDQSRHYRRQTPLSGSTREMRGRIIKALAAGVMADVDLRSTVEADSWYEAALQALEQEGMVSRTAEEKWCLTGADDAR